MTTSIVLADDHAILRAGIRALLQRMPGIEVLGEVGDGRSAVQAALQKQPDIIIMDMAMPEMNGIEATRQITKATGVKVVVLSMYTDKTIVREALQAGASGYLVKENCTPEELFSCIKSIESGRIYLSPAVADVVVRDYLCHIPAERPTVYSALSAREREVLQLVIEGLKTQEIASRLNLSRKTVETHRRNMLTKLELKNTTQLISWALRQGWPLSTG